MPASSVDSLLHIQESLKNSLSKGNPSTLDQRLVSSSKKILMHKIEFRPAERASHVFQFESLRSKYIPLNAGAKKGSSPEMVEGYKTPEGTKMIGESLPSPKIVLFPPDKVQLDWCSVKRIGAGLVNLGNTCFLNSTLQCLTYSAPLVNYLIMENHSGQCKQAGFCMLCELHQHIRRCFEQSGGCIKPHNIVHKLRVIARHMHLGRQEDAHEFLRYVVDHMQKSCLSRYPKLDNFSKDTSAVYQIFGGYLRSQVLCLRCKARSNTYDPFLDISLDIKNSPSVQKALERYVQPERLDSDNAYNCTKCKQKVPAQKRFTVHKSPNVLTLQLKRFDCSRPSAKVTRHVQFPERLDISPYTSSKGEQSQVYQLYAVLVHSGYSCNSGHYYCYVRAPNRMWYCMNDQHVSQTSVNRVMSAEAYLLFYQRNKSQTSQLKSPMVSKAPVSKAPVGAHSTGLQANINRVNNQGRPCDEIGTPLARETTQKSSTAPIGPQRPSTQIHGLISKPGATPSNVSTMHSPSPSTLPGAAQRSKISFGIKSKDAIKEAVDNKPRLVMHIKHGKVCYNSVDEKKHKASEGKGPNVLQKLVPYNGESDSSEEAKDPVPSTSNGTGSASKSNSISAESHGINSTPNVVKSNGTGPKHCKSAENGLNRDTSDTTSTSHKFFNGHATKSPKSNFEPVIDEKLSTTRTVPGSYGPLDRDTSWFANRKDRPTLLSKDDSHHMFPRMHKTKVLRRSFSDDGLVIDVVPPKVNATTRWNILDTDAQISPSLASGSSTGSINSTTEWHVLHGDKHKNHTPAEPKPAGWTVTPTKVKAPSVKGGPQESNLSCLSEASSLKDTQGSSMSATENGLQQSAETSETVQSTKSDQDKKTTQVLRNTVSESDVGNLKKSKKNGAFSFKLSCINSGSDSPIEKKPLLKNRSYDMSVYDFNDGDEVVEKDSLQDSKLPQEPRRLPQETSHSKHKKKKHKKSHEEMVEDLDTSSHSKKKKKKKHKKKKYEDRDEEVREEAANAAKRIKEEVKAEEYTWVEKSVPVKSWDQNVDDGTGVIATDTSKCMEPKTTCKGWDGTRNNNPDILSELQRTSEWGRGTKVMSWEGDRSHLDQSADRRKENKRRWSDDYEEDLDRGKTKKMKNVEHGSGGSHGNMFQRFQDTRQPSKDWSRSPLHAPDRDRRYDGHTSSSSFHHKSGYHDRKHGAHHNKHRDHHHKGSYRGRHER